MVDASTFEDPIDVKLAMLLVYTYPVDVSVNVRGSNRCEFYYDAAIQLYANYAEGLHFSAFHLSRNELTPALSNLPVTSLKSLRGTLFNSAKMKCLIFDTGILVRP